MTEAEIRMRSMELATRHILAAGPQMIWRDDLEKQASNIVRWVKQTPVDGDDLRAYLDSGPVELGGLRDELAARFGLSKPEAAYVLSCTIAGVLECRKARD